MYKLIISSLVLIGIVSFQGCNSAEPDKKKVRPMVYEGMPISDLTVTLGAPDSILTGGSVYNADLSKTQKVEKWYFDTRTVVVIDDTVKTPNLNER